MSPYTGIKNPQRAFQNLQCLGGQSKWRKTETGRSRRRSLLVSRWLC